MRFKVYERTGIKELSKIKESQSKLIEKQNSEQEMKHSIERGMYKESCGDKYNLDLMNLEREYKKTENLLMLYQDMSIMYEANVGILIGGYLEYFYTYGSSMTALGLRGFRKSMEASINVARNIEKWKKREVQIENTVLDFVVDNYDEIKYLGEEINVPGIMYLMFELELSPRNQQEYNEIQAKVKSIYDEFKNN